MSVAEAQFAGARSARDVLMGREPEILAGIEYPGVAASIWTRSCDKDFQHWIDSLRPENLPELRTSVPVRLPSTIGPTHESPKSKMARSPGSRALYTASPPPQTSPAPGSKRASRSGAG